VLTPPVLMPQHGTFIRSIRTNEGWARTATHATHVALRHGCDIGVAQGKSMAVAVAGKTGNALVVPHLSQANTIPQPRTTAGMRADKAPRANRQCDGLGIVESSQEFVRKQEDEEEGGSNMRSNIGGSNMRTHTHGRTQRAIKRPFWSDSLSPSRATCCNHAYPCPCAVIL
jgi:hypothetical protein